MATATSRTSVLSALDVIYTRRSIRQYRAQPLDRDTIRGLIDAAVQAPTAMHVEPWAFVVVQDPAMLRRYSEAAKSAIRQELAGQSDLHHVADPSAARAFRERLESSGFDIFYGASALIVICGKPAGSFVEADCWLAAENLMLAATAMGLGSCCIGSALPILTSPDVRRELAIPDGFDVVAPVVVGIPAEDVHPESTRKEPHILSWS